LYLFELAMVAGGVLARSYLIRALAVLSSRLEPIRAHFWLDEYVLGSFGAVKGVAAVIASLSLLKRKVIVCGDRLLIKSATFVSRVVPLSEVATVELLSPFQVLHSFARLRRVAWRWNYHNPLFWRPGVLVTLKDGRGYFLGVKSSAQFAAELTGLAELGASAQAGAVSDLRAA
jgi:hypothetical protein